MRLFINNREIELDSKTKIAQTIQVNDLADIKTRQSNYTNSFKIPRTSKNELAFGLLGVNGNVSEVPYKLNKVFLIAESGEVLINDGHAQVKTTTGTYNIVVYYGNYDLFNEVKNDSLSDLGLTELTHEKTVANVIETFDSDTLKYKYIVADYGGKTTYNISGAPGFEIIALNIDYLVPSINVKYLWDKIFEVNGFTYEGSVFLQEHFQNMWMSYPKGIPTVLPDVELYNSTDIHLIQNPPYIRKSLYLNEVTSTTNDLQSVFDAKHFKVDEGGLFRIELTGELIPYKKDPLTGNLAPIWCDVWLAKNSEDEAIADNVDLIQLLQSNVGSTSAPLLDVNSIVELDDNESLCIVFRTAAISDYPNLDHIFQTTGIEFTITKTLENEVINFDEALVGFKITDFMREVMVRWGVTPYKQINTNHYKFLTLDELVQTENIVDWSASETKFSSVVSESYFYGSYAQTNYLRHKYDDPNDNYNDGVITVDNVNLKAEKTIFNSSIFTPSNSVFDMFNFTVRTYKMWNREINDDSEVSYDRLDNRFFFLRSGNVDTTPIRVVSEELGEDNPITSPIVYSLPVASNGGLSYRYSVSNFYSVLRGILKRAKVIKAKIFLTEQDISTINLIGVYFIRELGGYFILNKIKNFIKKGKTDVELVKLDFSSVVVVDNSPIINLVRVSDFSPTQKRVHVLYDSSRFTGANIDYVLNGGALVSIPNNGDFIFLINSSVPEVNNELFLTDGVINSETVNFSA